MKPQRAVKRRESGGRAAAKRPAVAETGNRLLPAAFVFALALTVRLLYLLSIHDTFFFHQLQTEPLHYHQWATLILDGPAAPLPPFEQSPGFPYFVAAIYALFGRSLTAVACLQALLDAATCALLAVVWQR